MLIFCTVHIVHKELYQVKRSRIKTTKLLCFVMGLGVGSQKKISSKFYRKHQFNTVAERSNSLGNIVSKNILFKKLKVNTLKFFNFSHLR